MKKHLKKLYDFDMRNKHVYFSTKHKLDGNEIKIIENMLRDMYYDYLNLDIETKVSQLKIRDTLYTIDIDIIYI